MTPAELVRKTPLPRHEAERLLEVATGVPRFEALTRSAVPEPVAARYRRLVARRRRGEPLQYIEGFVPFGPIEVGVDPRVFIPRPETEELFTIVAAQDRPEIAVDLCTGSGCLGLALAAVFSDAAIHLVDLSSGAIDVASANARRLDLDVSIWRGDLFDALPDRLRGRVDLLVANPPYLSADDIDDLGTQVRDHEPRVALVAGHDGLMILRRIAVELDDWLSPRGRFGIEIGQDQGSAVAEMFAHLGGAVRSDIYGMDRFVMGERVR